MQHPFEYFALRYLLLWEQSDRLIYESMQGDSTPKQLRSAFHNYRVSRNFKGMDDDKAVLILAAVKELNWDQSTPPVNAVKFLVSLFSKEFKQANLSAATKLMWFRHRHPFVILDTQAISGLRKLGHKFNPRSYEDYEAVWRLAFNQDKDKIRAAVGHLSNLQPFLSHWHKSPESIEALAKELWFQERVYDLYLWELGAS